MAVKKKKKSRNFRYFSKVEAAPKPNPFDLKANHKKYTYVCRGKVKGESGRPTESRSLAIERRKTRIKRYITAHERSNRFNDRRVGEGNVGLTEEQKSLMRLQALKTTTSADIDFQPDCHFTTNQGAIGPSDDEDGEEVMEALWSDEGEFESQNDKLREAVAKSKLAKAERMKEKTEIDETTARMNTDWESMRPLLRFRSEGADFRQSMPDEYDSFVQSLRFSQQTKNVEREMKFEGKQEYEDRMNREAADRMKPPCMKIHKYVSPDDLDDDNVDEAEKTADFRESRPSFLTELSHVPSSEEDLKSVPHSFESFMTCISDLPSMLRSANPLRTGGDKTELRLLAEHVWKAFSIAASDRPELLTPLARVIQTMIYHYPELCEFYLRDFLKHSFELAPVPFKNAVLRLISRVYSVTDYRHRMGSVALLRGADLLRSYKGDTLSEYRNALNTCLIMTEYVEAPGRLMPELIHCLLKIVRHVGAGNSNNCTTSCADITKACGNCILRSSLGCLRVHAKIAAALPCGRLYLQHIAGALEDVNDRAEVEQAKGEVAAMLERSTSPALARQLPSMIAMTAPHLKAMFLKAATGNEYQRRLEIRRRFKKEMRCAAREIKREGQVLSGIKLEKQKLLDKQRMEKVKRIMDDLANQEGDYRKIKKNG